MSQKQSLLVPIVSQKSTTFHGERKEILFADENFPFDVEKKFVDYPKFLSRRLDWFKQVQNTFATKRNHWTLCWNCLIKFSVAAKLKICFSKKIWCFCSIRVLCSIREPMVFGSVLLAFFSFPSRNASLFFYFRWKLSSQCLWMEGKVFVPFCMKSFSNIGATSSNYWFSTSVKLSSENVWKTFVPAQI